MNSVQTCKLSAIFAVALLVPSLSIVAQDDAPPKSADREIIEKAQRIVEAHTAESEVWVAAFDRGVRIIGVTVEETAESPQQATSTFTLTPPEWFREDDILGFLGPEAPFRVRLLWRVEPTCRDFENDALFSVVLAHHAGYGRILPDEPTTRVSLKGREYGSVVWTDLTFSDTENLLPGRWDLLVTSRRAPARTIPIGQVWLQGSVRASDDILPELMRTVGDPSQIVLSGQAVMTQWSSLRFPVPETDSPYNTLRMITSVDWLQDAAQGVEVATVTAVRKSGSEQTWPIRVGIETAVTWYDLFSSGSLPHEKAEIAWTWPVERETTQFDAAVYESSFELTGDGSPVESIRVDFTHTEGILRIRGIALTP